VDAVHGGLRPGPKWRYAALMRHHRLGLLGAMLVVAVLEPSCGARTGLAVADLTADRTASSGTGGKASSGAGGKASGGTSAGTGGKASSDAGGKASGGTGAGGKASGGSGGIAFGGTSGGGAANPCAGVVCDSAPEASCSSWSTLQSWSSPGKCSAGTCAYPSMMSDCPAGCDGNACSKLRVSAGTLHTCAVTAAGGVQCWGAGSLGPPGSLVPVALAGLSSGVTSVSVSTSIALYAEHTCVVTDKGGVKCWDYANPTPLDVMGFSSTVVSVAAGGSHNCALTSAGAVQCWGNNGSGQLGNNTRTSSTVPVDVVGLASGAIAVSVGEAHSCAVTSAGGVKCWGADFFGQLGDGTTQEAHVPVDVSDLTSGAATVSAGLNYACALTTAGGVKCWGYGQNGQLGNGGALISRVPVDVTGLASGVFAISATSYYNACALTTAGGVKCWGASTEGELGNGSTTTSFVPVDVKLRSGAVAVTMGAQHGCAISATFGLECWGRNLDGELGNDSTTNSAVPVEVNGF